MKYKGENVPGKIPECGAIFMSNTGTKDECFNRKLFGLPYNMSDFVLSVKKGMTLFLFKFNATVLLDDCYCIAELGLFGALFFSYRLPLCMPDKWWCFRLFAYWQLTKVTAEMKYKGDNVPGKIPECGAIFMSNTGTKDECFNRKLFGLPYNMSDFVLSVKKGMTLFLFEFEKRQLYGVFRAISDGEIDIQPRAYSTFGKKFPAQVRFTTVWNCTPLAEHEFQGAIKDNYYSGKFYFGLNQDQVDKLMELFRFKEVSKNPERNVLRHGDKPAEGHARFDDLRKTIKDRLRVVSKEDDHITSNEKIVEVDKLRCGRKKDRFKKRHARENDEFGDRGAWKKLLGNHLPLSLAGFNRKAAVGSHYMADVNNGHEMNNNLREIRGSSNQDNFSIMEKAETENDVDNGFIPLFTEPLEDQYDEIAVASDDAMFLTDWETVLTNDVSPSHLYQNTCWTTCEPTIPFIPLYPSYYASDPSFIPLDTRPFCPHSHEIAPSSDSHNEGSIRYFEGNRVSKTFSQEDSLNPIFPKFIQMRSTQVGTDENFTKGHESHAFNSSIIPAACKDSYSEEPISKSMKKVTEPSHALQRLSCDADLCVHDDDSYNDDRSQINKTVNIRSVIKQDDDDDIHLKGFDKTECLGGATSYPSCKLVGPAFVEKESTGDGVSATKITDMLCEITPSKDESCSTEVVVESKELVDESIKSADYMPTSYENIVLPNFYENTLFKDYSISTECPNSVDEGKECSNVEGDEDVEDISCSDDNISINRSEKVDGSIKLVQMLDKCQKSVGEGEDVDGNAEVRLLSDGFVEVTQV
ncbi:Development/cell death domain-containing protein [Artemisia annua]|uniref:Development/cell death domain-containing protein n=1 Tax=Artemisia annua TaxID=35608 RepID=A0A2U1L418_ARTAN|nr:Development/cell death domain-containing protein [Artemisia annua]